MDAKAFVIAVDFGGTKIDVATATPSGEIIGQVRLDTQATRGAEQAVDRAIEAARSLIDGAEGETGGVCVAAGVVCPGIPLGDRVALAPNVPGWEDLALEAVMRAGLGLSAVAVGNDVRAAALAELRSGTLTGADPALFLNLGTGVAAAVLVGGRVLPGAHGAAGEIGYSLLSVEDPRCFADGGAPLEEHAGGRFIGLHASRGLGRPVSAADAFAARDPATRETVDRALDELAVHVANLALLLDPERIAVGRGLMASADRVLGALQRRLHAALPFAPELVSARFVHDGALRGAVALALDRAQLPADQPRVPAAVTGSRP